MGQVFLMVREDRATGPQLSVTSGQHLTHEEFAKKYPIASREFENVANAGPASQKFFANVDFHENGEELRVSAKDPTTGKNIVLIWDRDDEEWFLE